MKIRRYKKVNKHINFYVNSFGFRQPYQLLIDGTFCFAALNNQINIADNIPRYLQGELKLLTTQCVIIETENLGSKLHGTVVILKQYALHKCGHEGKPIPGADCLLSMVENLNNDKHYMIATQDRDLQEKLRTIPGVPLLYLHSKAPVLDVPSNASLRAASKFRFNLQEKEKVEIDELKQRVGLEEVPEDRPRRKKRKGPNPLSCKKKKKKLNQTQNRVIAEVEGREETENKKRRKIRIAKHVREELFKNIKNG